MNRINQLFAQKQQGLLSLYFCAGHPTLESTLPILRAVQERGIDFVEVGIPFSDPMADGPVIQDAATRALRNGMTLRLLFRQLEEARAQGITMPLILMGYLNPILRYGLEEFFERCRQVGIDGVIIPDLPFRDYLDRVRPVADRHEVRVIMLITPETSEERIRFIDSHTDGFIYMVSSAAVTGAQREFDEAKQAYFNRVNHMGLRHPRMIGFGISNRQTLQAALDNASGAIIGSKFVQLLGENPLSPETAVEKLMEALAS